MCLSPAVRDEGSRLVQGCFSPALGHRPSDCGTQGLATSASGNMNYFLPWMTSEIVLLIPFWRFCLQPLGASSHEALKTRFVNPPLVSRACSLGSSALSGTRPCEFQLPRPLESPTLSPQRRDSWLCSGPRGLCVAWEPPLGSQQGEQQDWTGWVPSGMSVLCYLLCVDV